MGGKRETKVIKGQKKGWMWLILCLSFVLGFYGVGYAKVSGPCANCHTMHYSQTPWPSQWPTSTPSGATGPFRALTVSDCVGCHSGSSAIKTGNIPVVNMTTDPGTTGPGHTLAGGNFYWVVNGDDTAGHNVSYLVGQDSNLGLTPPGWDPSATSGFTFGQVAGGATTWTTQLTCAGTYGCHGDHTQADDFAAIYGAHHTDDSTIDGSSVGKSYRFLAGILGIEDSDWEYTASDNSTDHNEYKGANGNASYADKTTISYLCAECHGYFHSQIGGSTHPWLRHPTDIALPGSGTEYYYYNGGTGTGNPYSVVAPVGEVDLSNGVQSTVNPGTGTNDIVLCISCHRAHGSENADLLRWDYSTCTAGSTTSTGCGCFICHTQKGVY